MNPKWQALTHKILQKLTPAQYWIFCFRSPFYQYLIIHFPAPVCICLFPTLCFLTSALNSAWDSFPPPFSLSWHTLTSLSCPNSCITLLWYLFFLPDTPVHQIIHQLLLSYQRTLCIPLLHYMSPESLIYVNGCFSISMRFLKALTWGLQYF